MANDQPFSGTYSYQDGLNLDGDAGLTDDARFGYGYNSLAPAPLSPASGYSGTSGTFYGGFVINTLDNATALGDTLSPNGHGVHQNGSTDHLKFQTQHSGNHHHTFALMMYWDKTGFLNDTNLATVTFDATSNLSVSVRNDSNLEPDAHLHFVVRNGTQFYVSQAFWGGVSPSTTEPGYQGVFPDGATINYNPAASPFGWKAYNPTGLDLQFGHGSWVTPTFDNVTAVGFYVDTLNFTGGPTNNSNLEITGFAVNAVPEASHAVLSLGALGALMLRRRRA